MASAVILIVWALVTGGVVTLVVRPWKTAAARAPLPVGLAVALGGWVLVTGAMAYADLIAQGSWTAASIALPFVPAKAIVYALLAYAAGRMALTARASAEPRQWIAPAALAMVCVYFVSTDVIRIQATAREAHARDPAMSAEDVSRMVARIAAGEAKDDELFAFLGNPRCPPELLQDYAARPEVRWRRAVARNDAIAPALAAQLAGDSDQTVRWYLAFNRTLPPDILTRLAVDASEDVRETVAWTDGLPDEAFTRLVDDPSPKVRATVARQSRISEEALAKLRQDPDQRVRDAANRWQ